MDAPAATRRIWTVAVVGEDAAAQARADLVAPDGSVLESRSFDGSARADDRPLRDLRGDAASRNAAAGWLWTMHCGGPDVQGRYTVRLLDCTGAVRHSWTASDPDAHELDTRGVMYWAALLNATGLDGLDEEAVLVRLKAGVDRA